MSILVVFLVAAGTYVYLRHVRIARQHWLSKLNLPGRWYPQDKPDSLLVLSGGLDEGDFTFAQFSGRWRLVGHSLCFDVAGDTTVFDLHFFRAGEIGLEDKNGVRILYSKQATNVIPLHRRRAADSDGSA